MIIHKENQFSAESLERDAALSMAARGIHVFPLATNKAPLTPGGFYDASVEPDRIADWWDHYPGAGVAMRTGRTSNRVVLDLDSTAAIDEALRRGLPDNTDVVRTRRGLHWVFRAPDEPLPSRVLFDGAELKAEGAYVVAPPSLHQSGKRYRLIPSPTGKLAELQAWILEALAERQHTGSGSSVPVTLDVAGPPILEGRRNRTLFEIGCSLRRRGADHAAIAGYLTAVNPARCKPPLEHSEVEGIAKSACRYAPGTAKLTPHVSDEVHEMLDDFTMAVYGAEWRGKAGKTDRDVLLALIGYAHRYGTLIPAGVRVSVGYRDLKVEAGIGSSATLSRAIKRSKQVGWLRQDNAFRRHKDAGAFVLIPQRPQLNHLTIRGSNNTGMSGSLMDIPRLRHGGVGKKRGHFIDTLQMLGGSATVPAVAAAMHEPRPDRLRREHVIPSAEEVMVEFAASTDVVTLTDKWQSNLKIERGLHGEVEREKRQRERHEEERRRFHGDPGDRREAP